MVGNYVTRHFTRYQSQAHMIGIVLGGSRVGKRHDRIYVEGFAVAGYALKVSVKGFYTQYFPDLYTTVARRDRFDLKFGLMLGLVGY